MFINEAFSLSADEIDILKTKAAHGDAEACEELSNFYLMVALDDEAGLFWLRRAVQIRPQDKRLRENLKCITEVSN